MSAMPRVRRRAREAPGGIDRGLVGPIVHRLSFTTDGSDPVGDGDAVLHIGASVSAGALVLADVEVLERYRAIFADGFDSGNPSAWLPNQP